MNNLAEVINLPSVPVIQETPLIWTSKGNVPISSLVYETLWDNQDHYIKFMENYYLSEGIDGNGVQVKGELVKGSAHVYVKKPLESVLEQGAML